MAAGSVAQLRIGSKQNLKMRSPTPGLSIPTTPTQAGSA